METKIELVGNKSKLTEKPLIQSFSGSGAIGTILSSFLVKSLKMEEVALIHTNAIPPVAIVQDGKVSHPIRIFCSEKLCLMSCEVPIPYSKLTGLLEVLINFYIENNVKYIMPVGGVPNLYESKNREKCYAISYNDAILKKINDKGISLLKEGVVYGSIAKTLEICQSNEQDNCFSLIVECDPNIPSYNGTSKIIDSLGTILDIQFDKKEFDQIVEVIKQRIEESTRYFDSIDQETYRKTRESHL